MAERDSASHPTQKSLLRRNLGEKKVRASLQKDYYEKMGDLCKEFDRGESHSPCLWGGLFGVRGERKSGEGKSTRMGKTYLPGGNSVKKPFRPKKRRLAPRGERNSSLWGKPVVQVKRRRQAVGGREATSGREIIRSPPGNHPRHWGGCTSKRKGRVGTTASL